MTDSSDLWSLSQNGWKRVPDPALHGDDDITRGLRAAGWKEFASTEDTVGRGAIWYKLEGVDRHLFMFGGGDEILSVVAEDLPSALQIWQQMAQTFVISGDETHFLIARLFKAWHGHDPDDTCAKCKI